MKIELLFFKLICTLFFLSSVSVKSQSLGGSKNDEGMAFCLLDNSYILIGSTRSYGMGSTDVLIANVAEDMSFSSNVFFGYIHQDFAADIITTYNNNYVVLINSWDVKPGGRTDVGVIKYDRLNNHVWTSYFGESHNDHAYSIKETFDHGYIITGLNRTRGLEGSVFLRKIDENGVLEWEKFFDIDNKDLGKDIVQLPDSSFILLAEKNSFFSKIANASEYVPPKADIVIIKTDPNGNQLWSKTIGRNGHDFGSRIVYYANSLYFVGSSMDSTTNSFDIVLRKMDINGNLVWEKAFGGPSYDYGNYLDINEDGEMLITGSSNSFSPGDNSLLVYYKIDSNGNELWMNVFGDSLSNYGTCGKFLPNNEIAIVGTTTTTNKDKDILFFKTDTDGNMIRILSSDLIDNQIKADKIIIYPNPARESFTIIFPPSQINKTVFVNLYNSYGEVVYSKRFPSELIYTKIPIKYSKGIYIYTVIVGDKKFSGKLIIN